MAEARRDKVTIFDVAKRAGVSIKTVSRVVNREPNVRDATRAAVQRAIAELNYRPDRSARSLASQRSNLIGLVYDDPAAYELPSSGYIIRLQHGALRACHAALHELLIHPCDYRERTVGSTLSTAIRDAQLAGVVVVAPLSNTERIVRAIRDTDTPFVRVSPGHKLRKHHCVETNDVEACAQMVDHLASLGHERIAFITGNATHDAVVNRFDGYRQGLERNGIAFRRNYVCEGDNSFHSGVAASLELLRGARRPTAIFAANDDMAIGVFRTARNLGIRIPDQLSVAGFDDIVLGQLIEPELTTVRQPLSRMAERAVEILTRDRGGGPKYECISSTLEIRGSTGPPPG